MKILKHGGNGWRWPLFLTLLLLVIQVAVGEIVPADRRIDWTGNVGIPGGIPNRTTIYTTVPAGASLATVQAAVNGCPTDQVVKLSAGTYTWPSGSSLNMKSGVTLRGAGPDSTIINSSAGSAQHGEVGGITFSSDVYTGASSVIPLSSGYTKGSTTLVTGSTDTNLRAGYTIVINQVNDGTMVYNGPAMPGGYLRTDITPEGDGLRCLNQRALVTAIDGNNITISPPLYYTMSSSLSPHIFYYRSSSTSRNNIQWAGVEDLSVVNSNSEGTCIGLNRAAYCWVKNVKTVNAAVYHIGIYRAYRCEVRHNTCDSSLNYTSSHGYVIVLEYQSSACLVEDNIVVNNRQFVEANSGSSGNVIAYNYMTNAMPTPGYGFMVHSGGSHSAHPMMNLFEGNIGYKWNSDYYWGSSSHQTLLRNWFGRYSSYARQMGAAVVMDEKNSYNNVVGNVLGYNGINSNPNWTTRHAYRVSPSSMAYDRVWASIRFGYWSDSDVGGGYNAASQWANTIVAGNYDYVTGTTLWNNPTAPEAIPNSYYYPSKPAYFGNLAWPPIDPAAPTVSESSIPAGYRYANGVDPAADPGTNQPPTAVAGAVPTSGVAPLSVDFSSAGSSDPEGASLAYSWTFGDGTTSTAANPSKTYSTPGAYTARLTVSDGSTSATSGDLTINASAPANQAPVAAASATPQSGLVPLAVSFSSGGSSDPEGTALTYSWDFGDGSSSTSANPGHTYSTPGAYSANVTVSDGVNSTTSSNLAITVSTVAADTIPGQALVDFEAGSDGSVVTSAIMTSGTKGETWSGWKTLSNPGGGNVGSTPYLKISSAASHQLYTPANINGTTYAGDGGFGLRATMSGDNAVQLSFPSPGYQLSVGFFFRFNGPQINNSPRDVFGLRSDPTGNYQFLQIYDGPQPYFHAHWQPGGTGIGNNVNFNRNQWYWVTMCHVAGGGTMKISFYDPSKNYALVGTSTGSVSSGSQGCTAIQIGCIKYSSGGSQSVDFDNIIINTNGTFPLGPGAGGSMPANEPPVVAASATPQSGAAPLTVGFSSAGSSDPEGVSLSYSWTFGDGTNSTAANPSHTYSTAGSYSASLTVSDGVNSTTSNALTITASATPTNQPPVAVAGATPISGEAPLDVSFSSAGSSDPEGTALTYAWDFGDGTSSASPNPSHTYSNAGSYLAQLRVSDGNNVSVAATVTINATGLVAAYGFEETSGNTVTDAAGNRSEGTITTATRVPGKYGKALSFNGTDSLVSINSTPALALSSNLTLEAWINPAAADNAWKPVLFKAFDSSQISYVMQGRTPMNGVPSVYISPSVDNVVAGDALAINTWSHLAATYDGAVIRLYVNGVLAASQPQTGSLSSSSEPLTIGGNAPFQAYWNGLVDEVRIYNRALSAAEIVADMSKSVEAVEATPPIPPQNYGIRAVDP